MAADYTTLKDELVKLRLKAGLTVQSISRAPAVLEALGGLSPEQAYEQLKAILDSLDDSEAADVLRVAYGLDEKYPGSRVTHRREKYRAATGHDIKTLIRYENRMVEEVALQLARDRQKGRLFVTGWVAERRLFQGRVEFLEETPTTPTDLVTNYSNVSRHRSIPLFVYRLPSLYKPDQLVVGVFFRDEQPKDIWALQTPHLWEVSSLRYERELLRDDNCYYIEYVDPSPSYYYGLGWEW